MGIPCELVVPFTSLIQEGSCLAQVLLCFLPWVVPAHSYPPAQARQPGLSTAQGWLAGWLLLPNYCHHSWLEGSFVFEK